MKNKKVIIIGPAYPLRGGIVDSNHSLALALQEKGCAVKILSFSLQYPSVLFPGKSQYDYNGLNPNVEIVSLINSVNPASWIRAVRWIKKENPDAIITRYWLPFMAMSLGSILRLTNLKNKIPFIALCDNIIPHESRFGDAFLTSYFLKSNNRFLVMSKSVGEDVTKFIEQPRIQFHPHPVYDQFGSLQPKNEALLMLGLSSNKKYILFFGFIRGYKGLDVLLEAMSDVSTDVELIVAGEFYESKEKYDKIVQSNGISKRVHFYSNFIPQKEVRTYFSACDLVVQPYKTATQSGVAQIAYHFDKPMVVTNVGGLAEIVPDGKVGYVTEVNSDSVAKAINTYFENKMEMKFVANVKIEKLKYTWSNMAALIIKKLF